MEDYERQHRLYGKKNNSYYFVFQMVYVTFAEDILLLSKHKTGL